MSKRRVDTGAALEKLLDVVGWVRSDDGKALRYATLTACLAAQDLGVTPAMYARILASANSVIAREKVAVKLPKTRATKRKRAPKRWSKPDTTVMANILKLVSSAGSIRSADLYRAIGSVHTKGALARLKKDDLIRCTGGRGPYAVYTPAGRVEAAAS